MKPTPTPLKQECTCHCHKNMCNCFELNDHCLYVQVCEHCTTQSKPNECKNCGNPKPSGVINVEEDMKTCVECGKEVSSTPPSSPLEEKIDNILNGYTHGQGLVTNQLTQLFKQQMLGIINKKREIFFKEMTSITLEEQIEETMAIREKLKDELRQEVEKL